MTLVFATGNPHKVAEVQLLLNEKYHIRSLQDIGCTEDIPETQPTIQGNALQKMQYIVDKYGLDCFSEDTGLEVEALHGEPGVYSARYAGTHKNDADNRRLLLQKLGSHHNRKAQFRTVIALHLNGKTHTFEGIAKGTITTEEMGAGGFGYDCIFMPEGHTRTFAQMRATEKARISHRGVAVRKLVAFLEHIKQP